MKYYEITLGNFDENNILCESAVVFIKSELDLIFKNFKKIFEDETEYFEKMVGKSFEEVHCYRGISKTEFYDALDEYELEEENVLEI